MVYKIKGKSKTKTVLKKSINSSKSEIKGNSQNTETENTEGPRS